MHSLDHWTKNVRETDVDSARARLERLHFLLFFDIGTRSLSNNIAPRYAVSLSVRPSDPVERHGVQHLR